MPRRRASNFRIASVDKTARKGATSTPHSDPAGSGLSIVLRPVEVGCIAKNFTVNDLTRYILNLDIAALIADG